MSADNGRAEGAGPEENGQEQGEGERIYPAVKAMPELFEYYMIGIRSLWDTLKVPAADQSTENYKRILALFAECGNPSRNWDKLWRSAYEIEQRMVPYLSFDQLVAQSAKRLKQAEKLALPGLDAHAARLAEAKALDPTLREAAMQAEYREFLGELHIAYGKRRLDRMMRKNSAKVIMKFAFILVGLIILCFCMPAILGFFGDRFPWFSGINLVSSAHVRALALVISFGLLGAFFSRLGAFNASFAKLDYDDIVDGFQLAYLGIRLWVGAIGSIIIFYAIFGGLLGGELFPNIACVGDAKTCTIGEWFQDRVWTSLPNADYAKLVIWSFIGGFSERLIPDFLTRTEAQANAAKGAS